MVLQCLFPGQLLRTRSGRGIQLIGCRLGLEGLITFKKDTHEFDAENYIITIPQQGDRGGGEAIVGVFDKVTVEVGIEKDKNTQRGKVKMVLVEPVSSVGL